MESSMLNLHRVFTHGSRSVETQTDWRSARLVYVRHYLIHPHRTDNMFLLLPDIALGILVYIINDSAIVRLKPVSFTVQ